MTSLDMNLITTLSPGPDAANDINPTLFDGALPDTVLYSANREQIHRIWDHLAELPESQLSTRGLYFLLESISELIDAHHGYWISAFRLSNLDVESDMMFGWRPGPAVYYNEKPSDKAIYRNNMKEIQAGKCQVSESVLNLIRGAGRFRATLLRDLVSPDFFTSSHYRIFYEARNITDSLFVVVPVNTDTEVYFCFFRSSGQKPFEQAQLRTAADTLRCLSWLHKKVLLGQGLVIGQKALTPTEKKVLEQLLTDATEKQIAEHLGQKVDTTHKHIGNIYRKFNVKSRAALMSIWLGQPT